MKTFTIILFLAFCVLKSNALVAEETSNNSLDSASAFLRDTSIQAQALVLVAKAQSLISNLEKAERLGIPVNKIARQVDQLLKLTTRGEDNWQAESLQIMGLLKQTLKPLEEKLASPE